MSTIPPPDDRFEQYLKLVELVHTVRIIAYDKWITPPDAMKRIRDALGEFYCVFDDPDDECSAHRVWFPARER